MNNQSILSFVFDCIDQDEDSKITKNDIRKFINFQNPKNSKHIFFSNFISEVDTLKLKQNQTTLDFDQFRSNSDRLHFLIWPAYKLQETFRNQIFGLNAWFELYSKAQKRQYQIKNNQKKQSRLKERLQVLRTLQRKDEGPFFKDQIKIRKKNVISTDFNILDNPKKLKRNSAPYIKPILQIDKDFQTIKASK